MRLRQPPGCVNCDQPTVRLCEDGYYLCERCDRDHALVR